MTIEQMEIRLQKWEHFAWFCLGMSVSLLAVSVADLNLYPQGVDLKPYLNWFLLWLAFQTITAAATSILIRGKDWRLVPEFMRFQTIFEFLAADWILLLSFGLHLYIRFYPSYDLVILLILFLGVVLAGIFFELRKRYISAPESIFP